MSPLCCPIEQIRNEQIHTESMKRLGKIQKSKPKWNKNNHTKNLTTIKPTYFIMLNELKILTRKTRVQNEKYQSAILSHKGHNQKSMNIITIQIPKNKNKLSFLVDLSICHIQKPFSLILNFSPLANKRCLGYFFFASAGNPGCLSRGTSILFSMKSQPNLMESSILSNDVMFLTSLNLGRILSLFYNTISWKLSPIRIMGKLINVILTSKVINLSIMT